MGNGRQLLEPRHVDIEDPRRTGPAGSRQPTYSEPHSWRQALQAQANRVHAAVSHSVTSQHVKLRSFSLISTSAHFSLPIFSDFRFLLSWGLKLSTPPITANLMVGF
ncbi:hypothetical protein TB1_023970 [Malus domestica]